MGARAPEHPQSRHQWIKLLPNFIYIYITPITWTNSDICRFRTIKIVTKDSRSHRNSSLTMFEIRLQTD